MSDTIQTDPLPAPSEAAAGIMVKEVRRTFGDFVAVSRMDLTVPYGQVTALVGPNGAGKTTLLLMLATLLKPDRGTITVAGHDATKDHDAVRSVMGWSPDVFGMYDTLTVLEYLDFFARAYRLPKDRLDARCLELLALVRLDEFAARPVHVLSRGQKQRLNLARALIHDPKVVILDEPASGLDPRSRIELRDLLRKLAAEGRAVLVSSHILPDLEEVSDRVVFVNKGRVVGEHDVHSLAPVKQRVWRFHSLDDDALVRGLDAIEVSHGPRNADGVEVAITSDDHAADVVASLVGSGVRIISVGPLTSALEAQYMELTEDAQ